MSNKDNYILTSNILNAEISRLQALYNLVNTKYRLRQITVLRDRLKIIERAILRYA